MDKYKVYKIEPENYYRGAALVAAETADEANEFIQDFMDRDTHNSWDSGGYSYVDERDVVEHLSSDVKGIIDYGIWYCG